MYLLRFLCNLYFNIISTILSCFLFLVTYWTALTALTLASLECYMLSVLHQNLSEAFPTTPMSCSMMTCSTQSLFAVLKSLCHVGVADWLLPNGLNQPEVTCRTRLHFQRVWCQT